MQSSRRPCSTPEMATFYREQVSALHETLQADAEATRLKAGEVQRSLVKEIVLTQDRLWLTPFVPADKLDQSSTPSIISCTTIYNRADGETNIRSPLRLFACLRKGPADTEEFEELHQRQCR